MNSIKGKPITAYFNRYSVTCKGTESWRLRIRVDLSILEQIGIQVGDFLDFSYSPHGEYQWYVTKSRKDNSCRVYYDGSNKCYFSVAWNKYVPLKKSQYNNYPQYEIKDNELWIDASIQEEKE